MVVCDTGVESPLSLLEMFFPAGEKKKNGQNRKDMAAIALVESATRNDN